jgi:hemolysin activation/secretion protein
VNRLKNSKGKKRKFLITLSTLLLFASKTANSVPDAGSLLKGEEDIKSYKKIPRSIPKIDKEKEKKSKPVEDLKSSIFVNDIKFSGKVEKFKIAKLKSLLKNYINKKLSFSEINEAVELIQEFYLVNDFFLAKVTLLEQEVVDGIIFININEGRLDKKDPYVIKAENLRLYKDILTDYLENALSTGVTKNGLERALLNINDLPGVSAVSSIEPGVEEGSSKIILNVVEDDLVTGSITLDNHGNRYTAKQRNTIKIDFNNPSKIGDKLSINKTFNDGEKFDFTQFDYEVPVGQSGFKAFASASRLEFEIGKELKTNPVSLGKADTFEVGVKYPIQRTNNQSVFLKTSIEKKEIYNETTGVLTNDKTLENAKIGLDFEGKNTFQDSSLTGVSVSGIFGDLDLSKVNSDYLNDQKASGPKTHGDFNKVVLDFYHIHKFTDKINFKYYGSLQHASKNLDSSEKFSLGGVSGVRAYPSGEASGDEGHKLSFEVQYDLSKPDMDFDLIGTLFYDYGKIRQYKDSSNITLTTPNEYSLSGWGVSFDLIANERVKLNLGWAEAIGDNDGQSSSGNNSDGRGGSSRAWFQVVIRF